jgi:hypothetical protein
MSNAIFLPIVVLLVITFMMGRAIKGPQKVFARSGLLMILAGWGMNMHIEDASAPLAMVSSILIIFGLLTFLVMLFVQAVYAVIRKLRSQNVE